MFEAELIRKIKNGDERAFEKLYEDYGNSLMGLAFVYLKDYGDAQDAVQETFIKAYNSFNDFRGESKVYTWLYRICINICKSKLVRWKRKFFRGIRSLFGNEQVTDNSRESFPEKEIISREEHFRLREALLKLDELYRIPLLLKDFEGMSIRDTAEILKVTEQNVKNRVFRGRKKIRDILGER